MQKPAGRTQMSRRERVLQEMVSEGVHCVSTLKVATNRLLDRGGMTSVVRRTCIRSKVVPVYPRQSEVTWETGATERDFLQRHGHVRESSVHFGRVFVVFQRLINSINLSLEHGKNSVRFLGLSRAGIGQSSVGSHEADGTVLIILPVADRVPSPIEIPCECVDLAVGQGKPIGKCELVIRCGHFGTVGECELDGVTDEGVLRVLKACSLGQSAGVCELVELTELPLLEGFVLVRDRDDDTPENGISIFDVV